MNTVSRMIWKNVERLLREKSWTLAELGRQAGITPQHLNALRTGDKGIGEQILQRLAEALNVPPEHLVSPAKDHSLRRIAAALERIADALEE